MSTNSHSARHVSSKAALLPMLWFAPVIAIISWTAAYMFRDQFELMATLIGIGCAPIMVALSSYLYVLVNSVGD